ncbi:N-acetylglucosamine 6-phosphate deacetylase [Nocardioides sp. C4-1]|uniref:N-acetylglucosamine 6-phosphate deacetylase n=1 Tax=Nocardioides sp. C4-1 TaxID=3151851 RepID=UPI0032646D60
MTLVDLQVNGAGGIDLTSEPERLWEVGALLPAFGVEAWLPTVITADPTVPARALAALAAGPPPGYVGAEPWGLHLEGPFIATRRRGAHPSRWLADPRVVEGWTRSAGVAMVTLAPELPGAIELIEHLTGAGVVVAIGHTDADAVDVRRAAAAGATAATHLFNAMSFGTPRHPGAALAALDLGLVCGVIVDGHHLAPELVRLAWRVLGPERFVSVTDATAALGLPDGRTRLGDQEVVHTDGAVRLDDGTLAGAASSLPRNLALLEQLTGCTPHEATATATSTPRRLMERVMEVSV